MIPDYKYRLNTDHLQRTHSWLLFNIGNKQAMINLIFYFLCFKSMLKYVEMVTENVINKFVPCKFDLL